jgi:hypothetical protein
VPKQRHATTRKRIRKSNDIHRASRNSNQSLGECNLRMVSFLLDNVDGEVHKCESAGRWGKAGRLVRKWRMRFERLPAGKVRDRYLEELERRHVLLFRGEYIPVCVRTWARGRNIEEIDKENS